MPTIVVHIVIVAIIAVIVIVGGIVIIDIGTIHVIDDE